ARLGIADGDWVRVTSHHGSIKAQAKLMDGVNPHTVWTWNAIGKRAGAWNLSPRAAEAKRGFLLNHVISDTLPQPAAGPRYSNSDPAPGQAAWHDLRVKIEKVAADAEESEPQFPALPTPPHLPKRPAVLRYGEAFRRALDRSRS